MNRRQFLKGLAGIAAGAVLPGTVMGIDTGGPRPVIGMDIGEGSDSTAVAVMTMENGHLGMLDCFTIHHTAEPDSFVTGMDVKFSNAPDVYKVLKQRGNTLQVKTVPPKDRTVYINERASMYYRGKM